MAHVRSRASVALATLCLSGISGGVAQSQRLAVVVPVLGNDLERAVSSLASWPCAQDENVDLLLLHNDGDAAAGGASGILGAAEDTLYGDGGCFGKIVTVYADLDKEESVDLSTSREAIFYEMFEYSSIVRPQLSEYDALAVVDWEGASLATGRSFEQLYREAFASTKEEMNFWVKEGRDASGAEDGGAVIYNNRDPAFVAFLAHTRAVSGLTEPHDDAMWSAVADFHGRRSVTDKFVRSNLISDNKDDTPFVFSTTSPAAVNVAEAPETATARRRLKFTKHKTHNNKRQDNKWKPSGKNRKLQEMCDDGCTITSNDGTRGRVCDASCETGEPYGTNGCNARRGMFGANCRVCYNDIARALENDSPDDRAIMCDTLEPVNAYSRNLKAVNEYITGAAAVPVQLAQQRKLNSLDCAVGCEYTSADGTEGRVCDVSCHTGDPYGCDAANGAYGRDCRTCYNDTPTALASGEQAIMCDTMATTKVYSRYLAADGKNGGGNVAKQLRRQKKEASLAE